MAIVKMTKFNLIAFESQRGKILKNLQKFKEVSFVNVEFDESSENQEKTFIKKIINNEELARVEERINGVSNAISLVKKYHVSEKGLKAIMKGNDNYTFEELAKKIEAYNWKDTYFKLRDLGSKKNQLNSEISKKYTELENISLWKKLDINPKVLKQLKTTNGYLGIVPLKLKNQFLTKMNELEYSHYEELNVTKEDVYYLVISHSGNEEKEKLNEAFRTGNFSITDLNIEEVPKVYIEQLKIKIENLRKEKREIKEKIKGYDKELGNLEAVYEYLKNKKLRIIETEKLAKTSNTCIINGWIPTEKMEKFEKAIKEVTGDDYYVTFEEADKDDMTVPIKLKNNRVVKTFESLTGMYAYPKYNEVDPTPLLTPFYILFFGMMGADAGYGLVLLLSALFALKFVNLNNKMRDMVQFFLYLSFSVILWGVLYGSYFGLEIPGVWKLINPSTEFQRILIGAMFFGLIHIFFGLGVKAYLLIKSGKTIDAIYDVVLWYMAITGGIVTLISGPLKLGSNVSNISMWVMIIGMLGIFLTGGREAKSIGGKFGGGLYSLYGISSYVGDFVSYSRLMALGLSGGFIAQAMNMISGMLSTTWIGMVFVPVVFIGGHLFNMFISFLGAYVHTSRLIYVEFFGKFYEGGGKPFKEFRTESKYINIKD
ncbi:MAG: V-type ATP synthase subunit I [Leptotrichiaceae bacterium]|nr:V-type ATP synthase subunit I [Leptotrichiaceae bacterium]MBP7739448.1 V-type ATP synthase subunit I [Leptotrichiaceae bacterium]